MGMFHLPAQFYIKSLYQRNGSFLFSCSAPASILSTSFAVLTLKVLGQDSFLKKESSKIVSFLLHSRNELGYFIDQNFVFDEKRFHKGDYIKEQFTFFSLIALDLLNCRFDKLDFLQESLHNLSMHDWFGSLNFKDFWYESNRIMFLLYFLSYSQKYNSGDDGKYFQQKIDECFEILEQLQDPITGYWGTDQGATLSNGCFGAAHIYLFYDFFKRPIPHINSIIDSTLTLHTENGLVVSNEGGACEDYDVVEIYYRLMKQTDYRKTEIKKQLLIMDQTLNKSQFFSGGYPYRHLSSKNKVWKDVQNQMYAYSSWAYMNTPVYLPDSWATFFRSMTKIMIKKMLANSSSKRNYNLLPGWAFVD